VTELIPKSYVVPLEIDQIFGRRAPLEVDLGCGDGSFLAAIAQRTPDHDFIGIERLAGRVRSAARKAAHLTNVRVLRVETAYAVRYLLPPGSVSVFHLLFPDPWPKRRHHRRRIFTTEFLGTVATSLAPGGSLHIATDQLDYFQQIDRLMGDSIIFQILPGHGANAWPTTTFEKRFIAAGQKIYRVELRKVSPVM
jgi:tRNA (guanine-N7-)-methyltransferase